MQMETVKQNTNKILIIGGSGLLGTALLRLDPSLTAPAHKDFDINDLNMMRDYFRGKEFDTLLLAAAFTSPPAVDKDPVEAMRTNIGGTVNVIELCDELNLKLVYISTDYVFSGEKGDYKENDELLPQNLYAWSKLGGECAVRMYSNSLIIRTSFSENIFPFEKAFVDQFTSRDSVNTIAKLILSVVNVAGVTGLVHIGTERKSVKDLAIKLGKTEVQDLKRDEVSFRVPHDTSLNQNRMNEILKEAEGI